MGTHQELFLKMPKAEKCQEAQPDVPWLQGHSGWQGCWRRGWPSPWVAQGESIHGNWGFIVRVGIFITLSETLSTSLPGRMLSCPEVYERGFQLGGFNDKQVQFKGEL